MSESFDFFGAHAIVPGAVGEPGRRTFFLQVQTDEGVLSFKVEKQQVAALCEYLESVLDDLPGPRPTAPAQLPVTATPVELQWPIGGLGVAFEEDDERLLVVAEELLVDDEEREPATARFHLSPTQIASFIEIGNELVLAGRPACRLCGRPVDPDGHACPRLN